MKTVEVGGFILLEVPAENMDCDGCHLQYKDGRTAMQAAALSHLFQEQRGCGLIHGLKSNKQFTRRPSPEPTRSWLKAVQVPGQRVPHDGTYTLTLEEPPM